MLGTQVADPKTASDVDGVLAEVVNESLTGGRFPVLLQHLAKPDRDRIGALDGEKFDDLNKAISDFRAEFKSRYHQEFNFTPDLLKDAAVNFGRDKNLVTVSLSNLEKNSAVSPAPAVDGLAIKNANTQDIPNRTGLSVNSGPNVDLINEAPATRNPGPACGRSTSPMRSAAARSSRISPRTSKSWPIKRPHGPTIPPPPPVPPPPRSSKHSTILRWQATIERLELQDAYRCLETSLDRGRARRDGVFCFGPSWCFLARPSDAADPESAVAGVFRLAGDSVDHLNRAHYPWHAAARYIGPTILSTAFLTAASLALPGALVGLCDRLIGRTEFLHISVLFITWSALWTIFPLMLRRCGAGISVGLPLALAMLLMAGPITLPPLARQLLPGKDAGGSALFSREQVAQGIETASPLLGMLDAARPAIHINWQTLPHMYSMAEGQEVAFSLPAWWANALAYAASALLLAIPAWFLQTNRHPAAVPAPPSAPARPT